MLDDEKLVELLVRRDELLEQGREASPEEVCQDCPELLEEYQARLESLKRTDFLFDTHDGEEDDSQALPATPTEPLNDTSLPDSSLTIDQFLRAVTQSGLLTDDELQTFQQTVSTDVSSEPQSLARELVDRNKLTLYQASVLLAERSDPLLLDRYIILDTIDSGGMGLVFKALHRSLDRVVALKTLPPAAVDSEDKVKRFQREAKTAAMLSHPNIVTTHDAHESNGIHFLVMEYVKGKDLAKIVQAQGPLPVDTAVDYLLQAARGLEHAHAQGIIHRDIKPANLLLDSDGTVKVLDLGIARLDASTDATAETQEELTAAGGVMGTAAYMSPEQAANTHDADARSDIYSLGCTLYYLLTGNPPYREDTFIKTILAHRDKPIPPLSEARDDVPEDLIAVYRRMMAKSPAERYQSMTEVIDALSACGLTEEQITPETTPLAKPQTESSGRRYTRWWAAGTILALMLLFPLLYSVVFKINTPDGTLIVEVNEPDALVEIIDEAGKVEITRKSEEEPLSISVDPGKHRLRVQKDGFEFYTKEFSIASGGEVVIRARLEPDISGFVRVDPIEPASEVLESLKPVRTWAIHNKYTRSFAFNPDGSLLALGQEGKGLQVLNTRSWETQHEIPCVGPEMAFFPDGSLLALPNGSELTIDLQEVATGNVQRQLKTGYRTHQLALSPDGSVLLSAKGGTDSTVSQWDVNTGRLVRTLTLDSTLRDIAFSPAGSLVCFGTDNGPELWDVADGKLQVALRAPNLPKEATSIAFSPDGSMLATANRMREQILQIWDLNLGEVRHRLTGDTDSNFSAVAFSAEGSVLAAGCYDGTVTLWESVTGTKSMTFRAHTGGIEKLEFSPDGRWLATSSGDSTLKLWDLSELLQKEPPEPTTKLVDSLQPLRTWKGLKLAPAHAFSPANSQMAVFEGFFVQLWDTDQWQVQQEIEQTRNLDRMTISPDGSLLATSNQGGQLQLWDLSTGKSLWSAQPAEKGNVEWLAFSPDGTLLATHVHNDLVKFWDVTTGELRKTLKPGATCMAFHPDGSVLACATSSAIELWDLATENRQAFLSDSEVNIDGARSLAFNPDGSTIASTDRGKGIVRVWDVQSKEVRYRLTSESRLAHTVAYSPDGSLLATGWDHGTATLSNATTGKELIAVKAHKGSGIGVEFNRDGSLLATRGADKALKIWDVSKWLPQKPVEPVSEVLKSMQPVRTFADVSATGLAFSPDGSRLALGSKSVQLWDTSTWKRKSELDRTSHHVRCIAFSPDGSSLAVNDSNGSETEGIGLWDVSTANVRWQVESGYPQAVTRLVFSPDGSVLASMGFYRTAKLWNAATGKLLQTISPDSKLNDLALSPDGSILACATDVGPELWDADAAVLEVLLEDPQRPADRVSAIAFRPDGSMLASTHPGSVRVWDLESAQVKHRLAKVGTWMPCITFSRDGALLVAGGFDGSLTLWDAESGTELITFQGHEKTLARVEFSPDGRLLATGGSDKTIKIWDVSKYTQSEPSQTPPLAIAPFTPEQAKKHQQAWADHLDIPVEFENSIGMKMILIPPGEFMMGSSEEEMEASLEEAEEQGSSNEASAKMLSFEGPRHKVRITRPFRLAAHEATVGQFKAFVEATGYRTFAETNPKGGFGISTVAGALKIAQSPQFNWRNVGTEKTDQHPVVNVTWRDAAAFCEWLSKKERNTYRLPSEAQWEYGCRSGSTTRWCFGDNESELKQYAWYHMAYTAPPVGGKLPNALGLYDMHGNVMEWCSDIFSEDYYNSSPEYDPEGPPTELMGATEFRRVTRGGWFGRLAWELQSARRYWCPRDLLRLHIGFRPVLILEDPAESDPP